MGEFNYHLGLAVVTLSKSLYPHCSSVPSCIANRDLASAIRAVVKVLGSQSYIIIRL